MIMNFRRAQEVDLKFTCVRLSMTLRVSLRNLLTIRVAIDDNQDEKWPRNLEFISEL